MSDETAKSFEKLSKPVKIIHYDDSSNVIGGYGLKIVRFIYEQSSSAESKKRCLSIIITSDSINTGTMIEDEA